LTEAAFEVTVGHEDAQSFADLSGDWNPLHTDESYAAGTQFGRRILHGAFSAGLVSRMAGMHIPGVDCLLHGMQLKFLQPIFPPARLAVRGRLVSEHAGTGRVSVEITDALSGRRYVEASYEFSRHRAVDKPVEPAHRVSNGHAVTLVTGASGGIAKALLAKLGDHGVGLSRSNADGTLSATDLEEIRKRIGTAPIQGIIHCGWPAPDNSRLTKLGDLVAAVDHHVAQPLQQAIALAQILLERGTSDAMLLLVGSTAADPGRHNYRMPLYTLAKSMIPALSRILAVELAATGRRCAAVVFDVVDTGMNKGMSAQARVAHEDRSPAGRIPMAGEAADQLNWVMSNRNSLLSGATITLSGGAMP